MSITEAERFIDSVETNDTLAAALGAAADPAATYQVILDAGFDVQPAEIRDVLLERHGGDLTAEQLDAINGGLNVVEGIYVASWGGALIALVAGGAV